MTAAAAQRLRAALTGVLRRPARSGLAAAGVAVALATLLIAEGMAERGRRGVVEEIRRMGADVVVVDAQPSRNAGGRARTGSVVTTLRETDARAIAARVPEAAVVAAEYRGSVTAKAGDLGRRVTVSGDRASYMALREAPVARGRFFTGADEAGGQRVAVLGARVAADLFGTPEVVGRPIRLNGVPFTIVGVLPERGTGLDAFDEDEVVFVPLQTARRRLFNVDYVQRIFVRATRAASVAELRLALTALLAERHPRTSGVVDFRVQDQRRLLQIRQGAAQRLRAFQLAVAGVLLGAGAGGIFGLQLLTVRERRPEIGTRRALGATHRDIFAQFVTEALAVSATGSLAGWVLGVTGALLAAVRVPAGLAAIAALIFLSACSAAAAWPARQAARLPALEAFR